MLYLEERFTCEDALGQHYDVEVYREAGSRQTSSEVEEVLGLRQAFIVEQEPRRRVSATYEAGVFRIEDDGTILRRLRSSP